MPGRRIKYENGTLNFTVVGEGAVSIMARSEDGVSLTAVQGPFTVDRGEGIVAL